MKTRYIGATAFLLCSGMLAPPCDDTPARMYLETDLVLETDGEAPLVLLVQGESDNDEGEAQQFSFAHGTLQSNIIAAINTFASLTEVEADQSEINPARVELRSLRAGAASFVAVEQLSLKQPRLYKAAIGGEAAFTLMATGWSANVGDLNCDGAVDALDLLILLANWGACDDEPCLGDLNQSGAVDVQDLLMLLGSWGG